MDHIIKKPVKVTRYHRITFLLTTAAIITSLYLLSRYNYLYFHIRIEMFSIFVAYTIFAVTWNTRDQIESSFLIILGIDRKSTRLNSSHIPLSRMPSSA